MGENTEATNDGGSKRKRRRRRRRKGGGSGNGQGNGVSVIADSGEVQLTESDDGKRRKGRRQVDISGPVVSVPASGRNPYKKRPSRARRGSPGSAAGRKRKLSRPEVEQITAFLLAMPDHLVANLYRGLGGQPNRVANKERMIQLCVRAIAQGTRIAAMLKQLHERDRKALAAILQCGSIAHSDEFVRELMLSYGGHEREWKKTLHVLAGKGVIVASNEQDGDFFYIVPEPLVDGLLIDLADDLAMPTFTHPDVRVMDHRPFCPPLEFSVTTLATYIDGHHPRLTQRQEIYRHDKEEMDAFFAQIWEPESELFSFHLDFLMMHGMVELRGEYLSLNRDVMEEWLTLEAEDQRDLMFRALDVRFPMAEWVLWAIHGATDGEEWVAERPLVDLYRRWQRGEDWRDRFSRGAYAQVRTGERESYSFAPLVRCGILEMGQWGQEKFYRLSPRGRNLLEPAEDDGFRQFYLTPSFEIMAPAGLAPELLFRIGELAELVGCDRANTYKITEPSIEKAIEVGWRRDDVLQFLRDNSQIGLPDNVEATLKGWIGHRGDVEFHDLMLMTVHRSQIRKLEGNKRIKSYLLHRFAPGMYAVDRHRRDEIMAVLSESHFSPSADTRNYPGDPDQVEARAALRRMVVEAREAAVDPLARGNKLVEPDAYLAVPGSKLSKRPEAEPDLPPKVSSVDDVRALIDKAMSKATNIDMVYMGKNGQRQALVIEPQRFAFKSGSPVLVGLDTETEARKTFVLDRIERIRMAK